MGAFKYFTSISFSCKLISDPQYTTCASNVLQSDLGSSALRLSTRLQCVLRIEMLKDMLRGSSRHIWSGQKKPPLLCIASRLTPRVGSRKISSNFSAMCPECQSRQAPLLFENLILRTPGLGLKISVDKTESRRRRYCTRRYSAREIWFSKKARSRACLDGVTLVPCRCIWQKVL